MSKMIDGNALVMSLTDWWYSSFGQEETEESKAIKTVVDEVEKYVDGYPTYEPEQRWIPVSETVDVPEHEVLACDKYGAELLGFLFENDGQWMCECEEGIMYDVVAWMPKPEPYRGGENGE